MPASDHSAIAVDFLRRARAGDRAAAERLVTPNATHHNVYFAAGMPSLLDAIEAASKAAPHATFDVKHVIQDGEFVAVHSHVVREPNEPGAAVVHIFRFDGDRIAELWDVGMPIPANNPNADGAF
jgi:predicted SnoaL-like aldol condensation-catalyzing enzyme